MENMKDLLKAVGYEMELIRMADEIEVEVNQCEIYSLCTDVKYGDKLRDMDLINDVKNKIEVLRKLIIRINEIEMKAIEVKDTELMFRCECKKGKLINVMEYLNNKYMM